MKFKKGQQRKFVNSVITKTNLPTRILAEKVGVVRRTVDGWRNEETFMSEMGLIKLSEIGKIKIPKNVTYLDKYWYTRLGGKAGYASVIKKYGRMQVDEEERKRKWQKWYEEVGQYKTWQSSVPKTFNKPNASNELAEFFGIMMGDGGMTKYQITVSLHYKERQYGEYVAHLMEKLFGVHPTIRRMKNVHTYVLFRVELVKYLNGLGLKVGNKIRQNLDFPVWIKENKKYLAECLRGLFDTDGCLIRHSYVSNGKIYRYKKIDITSKSLPLLISMHNALTDFGIKNRISRHYSIRIEAVDAVERFFEIIRSSNSKHFMKYNNPLK